MKPLPVLPATQTLDDCIDYQSLEPAGRLQVLRHRMHPAAVIQPRREDSSEAVITNRLGIARAITVPRCSAPASAFCRPKTILSPDDDLILLSITARHGNGSGLAIPGPGDNGA